MNFFGLKSKGDSVSRSLPATRIVHGIEIKKAPVGQYVTALKSLEDVPQELIEVCFPGQTLEQIISKLKTADTETITEILINFLTGSPEIAIRTIARLGNFDVDALMALTPSELLDVVDTWWALNDLADFCKRIWGKIAPAATQIRASGSSNG